MGVIAIPFASFAEAMGAFFCLPHASFSGVKHELATADKNSPAADR